MHLFVDKIIKLMCNFLSYSASTSPTLEFDDFINVFVSNLLSEFEVIRIVKILVGGLIGVELAAFVVSTACCLTVAH